MSSIRLKPDKKLVKEADKKEVKQNINLITTPGLYYCVLSDS